jgi:hypothetical protein
MWLTELPTNREQCPEPKRRSKAAPFNFSKGAICSGSL